MLTVVDHLPLAASITGPRSNPLAACCLPDSQSLLELSLTEIRAILSEARRVFQANTHSIEPSPVGLRDTIRWTTAQFRSILEKLAARHHPRSRCGVAVERLRTELQFRLEFLAASERQLGELLTEANSERLTYTLHANSRQFRSGLDNVTTCLDEIRKSLVGDDRGRYDASLPSIDRHQVRDQLARVLARWWQTSVETPGPTTIALIDTDRILLDCPEFDHAAAKQLLNSAASLITTDRRAGRVTLALETPVISDRGGERIIAWSCALVEDADGTVQSILAAGLDRTKHNVAKPLLTLQAGSDLHLVSIPAAPAPPAERRRKQRLPFPHVQLVAPATGTALPPVASFVEHQCHDISEDGFSFLASTMPSSPSIVVALGTGQPHMYMTARVAHFTRCDGAAGVNYIVGCQFIGRTMLMSQVP